MIITTTPTIEGHPITAYLGVVHGTAWESYLGVAQKPTRSDQFPKTAQNIMMREAEVLGANAIVGVSFSHSADQGGIIVFISGTAVIIE